MNQADATRHPMRGNHEDRGRGRQAGPHFAPTLGIGAVFYSVHRRAMADEQDRHRRRFRQGMGQDLCHTLHIICERAKSPANENLDCRLRWQICTREDDAVTGLALDWKAVPTRDKKRCSEDSVM